MVEQDPTNDFLTSDVNDEAPVSDEEEALRRLFSCAMEEFRNRGGDQRQSTDQAVQGAENRTFFTVNDNGERVDIQLDPATGQPIGLEPNTPIFAESNNGGSREIRAFSNFQDALANINPFLRQEIELTGNNGNSREVSRFYRGTGNQLLSTLETGYNAETGEISFNVETPTDNQTISIGPDSIPTRFDLTRGADALSFAFNIIGEIADVLFNERQVPPGEIRDQFIEAANLSLNHLRFYQGLPLPFVPYSPDNGGNGDGNGGNGDTPFPLVQPRETEVYTSFTHEDGEQSDELQRLCDSPELLTNMEQADRERIALLLDETVRTAAGEGPEAERARELLRSLAGVSAGDSENASDMRQMLVQAAERATPEAREQIVNAMMLAVGDHPDGCGVSETLDSIRTAMEQTDGPTTFAEIMTNLERYPEGQRAALLRLAARDLESFTPQAPLTEEQARSVAGLTAAVIEQFGRDSEIGRNVQASFARLAEASTSNRTSLSDALINHCYENNSGVEVFLSALESTSGDRSNFNRPVPGTEGEEPRRTILGEMLSRYTDPQDIGRILASPNLESMMSYQAGTRAPVGSWLRSLVTNENPQVQEALLRYVAANGTGAFALETSFTFGQPPQPNPVRDALARTGFALMSSDNPATRQSARDALAQMSLGFGGETVTQQIINQLRAPDSNLTPEVRDNMLIILMQSVTAPPPPSEGATDAPPSPFGFNLDNPQRQAIVDLLTPVLNDPERFSRLVTSATAPGRSDELVQQTLTGLAALSLNVPERAQTIFDTMLTAYNGGLEATSTENESWRNYVFTPRAAAFATMGEAGFTRLRERAGQELRDGGNAPAFDVLTRLARQTDDPEAAQAARRAIFALADPRLMDMAQNAASLTPEQRQTFNTLLEATANEATREGGASERAREMLRTAAERVFGATDQATTDEQSHDLRTLQYQTVESLFRAGPGALEANATNADALIAIATDSEAPDNVRQHANALLLPMLASEGLDEDDEARSRVEAHLQTVCADRQSRSALINHAFELSSVSANDSDAMAGLIALSESSPQIARQLTENIARMHNHMGAMAPRVPEAESRDARYRMIVRALSGIPGALPGSGDRPMSYMEEALRSSESDIRYGAGETLEEMAGRGLRAGATPADAALARTALDTLVAGSTGTGDSAREALNALGRIGRYYDLPEATVNRALSESIARNIVSTTHSGRRMELLARLEQNFNTSMGQGETARFDVVNGVLASLRGNLNGPGQGDLYTALDRMVRRLENPSAPATDTPPAARSPEQTLRALTALTLNNPDHPCRQEAARLLTALATQSAAHEPLSNFARQEFSRLNLYAAPDLAPVIRQELQDRFVTQPVTYDSLATLANVGMNPELRDAVVGVLDGITAPPELRASQAFMRHFIQGGLSAVVEAAADLPDEEARPLLRAAMDHIAYNSRGGTYPARYMAGNLNATQANEIASVVASVDTRFGHDSETAIWARNVFNHMAGRSGGNRTLLSNALIEQCRNENSPVDLLLFAMDSTSAGSRANLIANLPELLGRAESPQDVRRILESNALQTMLNTHEGTRPAVQEWLNTLARSENPEIRQAVQSYLGQRGVTPFGIPTTLEGGEPQESPVRDTIVTSALEGITSGDEATRRAARDALSRLVMEDPAGYQAIVPRLVEALQNQESPVSDAVRADMMVVLLHATAAAPGSIGTDNRQAVLDLLRPVVSD
ncbi:MAG: hypothetical protein K2Z81_08150, partial [Cyanobacteria bacterium]|nr:hypothetical protein [Cyanobacteriota bacterium]